MELDERAIAEIVADKIAGTSIDRFSAKWAKATLDEVKP